MCSHAACYKGKGPVLCGPARGQRRLPGGGQCDNRDLEDEQELPGPWAGGGREDGEAHGPRASLGETGQSSRSQGWRGSREGTGGASFRSRQPLWVVAHHDRPAEGWDGVPPLSR